MTVRRLVLVVALVAGGLATAAPAQAATPTVTVTPATGLVHRQEVIVRGQHWPPGACRAAFQCVAGATTRRQCNPLAAYDEVDGRGRFRVDLTVRVWLDTPDGVVDCRLESCVVGINTGPGPTGARFTPIAFDPSGPDPARLTATATPDTDLVDEQVVVVHGEGFLNDVDDITAWAYECVTPVESFDDCDPRRTYGFDVDPEDGSFDEDVELRAMIQPRVGPLHDCRTGGCVLRVQGQDDLFDEAALIPLAFDPDAPLQPDGTFAPDVDTGLRDGQVLEITGEGWDNQEYVDITVCTATATNFRHCDWRSGLAAWIGSGPLGRFRGFLALHARFPTPQGVVDCRKTACQLVASMEEDIFATAVKVPVEFDPAGPIFRQHFDTDPPTGLAGGDRVPLRATVRAESWATVVQCAADARGMGRCASRTAHRFFRYARAAGLGRPWQGSVVVRRHLHLNDGSSVDCRRTACVLVLSDSDDRFLLVDRLRLRFGG